MPNNRLHRPFATEIDITGKINIMEYTKQNPLKVVTLFSGYDSQCLALDRIKQNYPEFDYELVAWCEFDPESERPIEKQAAVVAHNALFPQWAERNLGDITKVAANNVPDCDLITWSFPCTDISQAGRQEGLTADSGTRSSLAWEAIKIFSVKRPKFLLMENVPNLVSQKFIGDYKEIYLALEKIGYVNYPLLLNSKNYGVAQNRNRIYLVSILIEDENNIPRYHTPKPIPLKKKLKDYLEEDVSEDYYLSDEKLKDFFEKDNGDARISHHQWGLVNNKEKEYIGSLMATDYKQPPTVLEK